jgi:hypothetical protein
VHVGEAVSDRVAAIVIGLPLACPSGGRAARRSC